MIIIQLILMLLSFDENAGIVVDNNHFVQYEYIACLADPQALWFEDGSAQCWR